MRELLELATEKRLRAFHRQAHGAGLVVHSESNPFDDELESFDSGDLQDKIRSRGYWRIRIRPSVYSAKRIPDISDLLPLIQQKAIRIRGWDFPNVEPDYRETSFLQSHIAQRIDWENLIELWHFYQSGQFSFLGAFYWDWPGRFAYESEDRVLLVEAVVARYVEILELSARLSAVFSDSHSTWIQVGAHGLEGRFLETTAPVHNVFLRARTNPAQISQLVLEEEFSSEQLLAESEEIALRWARELFLRFNWKPESNVLEGIRRLFRGFA